MIEMIGPHASQLRVWVNFVVKQSLDREIRKSKVSAERRSSLADNFIDFKMVKARVSMEAVLGHYGIKLRKVNHTSLRGACPLPTHSSEKSKESFGVHTTKKLWACQSTSCAATRHGKKGGNILDF